MSDIAIRAEGLGKQYTIGTGSRGYVSLREELSNALLEPVRRMRRLSWRREKVAKRNCDPESLFWALDEVSFDVRSGEVVGMIGRNGAGKSTLLKILTRITDPTVGMADVHGRVGSLLEVGTGFHPELTGRENIWLNGAILGMTRREVQLKFDEIVSFAEVEKFIDTPVKRFSSGMYLRLAFAVAAHLEPEILLVDEVLAVGDAAFQKKCMGKMKDVGKQGRTVLFVSHNLPAVTGLCDRVFLLEQGRIVRDGEPQEVVSAYLNTGLNTTAARHWSDPRLAPQSNAVRLHAVRVRTEDGELAAAVDIRLPISIEMEFDVLKAGHVLMPHFGLTNENGVVLFSAHDVDPRWRKQPRPCGRYMSKVRVPGNFFSDGLIYVSAGCASINPVAQQHYIETDAVAFRVIDSLNDDTAHGEDRGRMDGVVRPLLEWTTAFDPPRKGEYDVSVAAESVRS